MNIKKIAGAMTGHIVERIHNEYKIFKWNRRQNRVNRETLAALDESQDPK